MVTQEMISDLKKKAEKGKNLCIEAEATKKEVERNIEKYKAELQELGIAGPEDIAKLEADLESAYEKAKALIPELPEEYQKIINGADDQTSWAGAGTWS